MRSPRLAERSLRSLLSPHPFEEGKDTREPFRRDLLHRYLKDVARYPLLSRHEEEKYARLYRRTGSQEALTRLMNANLRLVIKIAREYFSSAGGLLDLIQEGNWGLLQAVRRYDPDKGVKLSTYAVWWIRAYILKYLIQNFRIVRIGTTRAQRKIFYNISKERKRLEARGEEPNTQNLARALAVKEEDLRELQGYLSAADFSLETPLSDGSSGRHLDMVPDPGPPVDDVLAGAQLGSLFSEALDDFAASLNEREKVLFYERFLAEEPVTLREVGARFGFSREYARQLELRLLAKARRYFRARLARGYQPPALRAAV